MATDGVGGKVVIVTGASKGVGHGIALHLAERGAAVVATARKADGLAALAAEFERLETTYLTAPMNVADRDGAFDPVARTVARFGRVDGLVANAQSFRPVMALTAVTAGDMDTVIDTGPKRTRWGMHAVFPHMREQGWGRIVTMGSNVALTGAVGYGPYSASKDAIRSLTRTAAREWGPYGIVVNCVCPVSIAHRLPPADDPSRAAVYQSTFSNQPIARDGDAIHDIGPIVAFLLSDACRYMTGQTLMADGGSFQRP